MTKRPKSSRPKGRPENETVLTLERICGAPGLMDGEDADAYDELRAMLIEAEEPADIVGMLHVQNLTDLYWDEFRRRGCAASMVKAAMVSAMAQLLSTGCGPTAADDFSKQYAAGEAEERKQIEGLLADYGYTMADVRHVAFSRELQSVELLERLGVTGERRRGAIMRELEHRRETLARRRAEPPTFRGLNSPTFVREEDGVERIGARPPRWEGDS